MNDRYGRACWFAMFLMALSWTLGTAQAAHAQVPPAATDASQTSDSEWVPLKLTVVISRYSGDRRLSNLPFTLFVNANDPGAQAQLRMGANVPIPERTLGSGETTYRYTSIGTNIDAIARSAPAGRFRVSLTIGDTTLGADGPAATATADRIGAPSMTSFTSTAVLLLRDGETVQYTTASDKGSGEVYKIDVTLNVIK